MIPKEPLHAACEALASAEVAIVLGSGMHSWPFDITAAPKSYIVNLGATAKDADCTRKFDVSCDDFMHELCTALHVSVPNNVFEQKFRIHRTPTTLAVRGYNERECCTFASRATLSIYATADAEPNVLETERNLKW